MIRYCEEFGALSVVGKSIIEDIMENKVDAYTITFASPQHKWSSGQLLLPEIQIGGAIPG